MLKIITLICALFGLFTAVILEAWLRSRIVRNESSAESYAEVRGRNSDFWSIQYLPLVILLALSGAAIFFEIGRLNAAFFMGGALLCFVSVITGSRTVVTGSIASSSLASEGRVRDALRSAYRSAAVMGLSVTSIALIGLGVVFFFLDTGQLIKYIASLGLGASVTSLVLSLSGTAFSGAYSLSVSGDDFTDYTGMFIGSGADFVETFILSACAAALLAGVGVDTSGVTSTFTATSAARYPLMVLAAGIPASFIGVMAYRGRIVKNPAAGVTTGNFVAAVIVALAALYLSNRILQTYIYGICVCAGLLASLLSGEVIKFYSSDGWVFRRHLPDARKVGAMQSMIYSLSIGMISVLIPSFFVTAAMILGYKFANYYGIALAAAGINSLAGVNSAVRGFSINSASASEIASVRDPEAESPNPADVLLTASARTDVIGKTYTAVSTFVTLVAMFTALSVVANVQTANILSTSVFVGMVLGAVFMFICAGLIIRSIRITGYVLRDRIRHDDEKKINNLRGLIPLYIIAFIVPLAAGAAGGVSGLIAFASSASVTGICVIFSFNNAGKYFDRMAIETLGTVVKLMVAVTLVCAPAFIDFGGIL